MTPDIGSVIRRGDQGLFIIQLFVGSDWRDTVFLVGHHRHTRSGIIFTVI